MHQLGADTVEGGGGEAVRKTTADFKEEQKLFFSSWLTSTHDVELQPEDTCSANVRSNFLLNMLV